MKILVLGSSGLLGSSLIPIFKNSSHEINTHSFSSEDSDHIEDITNKSATIEFLKKVKPDVVINLICLSDVDECERDIQKSYDLNVLTTKNIVESITILSKETKLIQISTDQLYDSMTLNRENKIRIINNYSQTKYESEIVAGNIDATIIRTNFFGNSLHDTKLSFSDWVSETLCNEKIKYFKDIYFSPLSMNTISKILLRIIDQGLQSGVYNLGSKEGMSKYDFAKKIANHRKIKLSEKRSISIDQIRLLAKRPKGMLLDLEKFENTYNINLPTLEKEIAGLFE